MPYDLNDPQGRLKLIMPDGPRQPLDALAVADNQYPPGSLPGGRAAAMAKFLGGTQTPYPNDQQAVGNFLGGSGTPAPVASPAGPPGNQVVAAQGADGSPLNVGTGGDFLGANAPAGNSFQPPSRPGLPTPLTPDQYGNADMDAAAGSGFDQGFGLRRMALANSPQMDQRRQSAAQLWQEVMGRPMVPGDESQALDYYTRWSAKKNAEAAMPQQSQAAAQPSRMTIQNGVNQPVQIMDFNPDAATGRFLGAQVTNANDPDVAKFLGAGGKVQGINSPNVDLTDPQQAYNAAVRARAGLPFGTQPLGMDQYGRPLTGMAQMQDFMAGAQASGMSAGQAAAAWDSQQKNDLLGRQVGEKDDPARIRREETFKFLQQNPNATPDKIIEFQRKLEGQLAMTSPGGRGAAGGGNTWTTPHAGATGTLPPPGTMPIPGTLPLPTSVPQPGDGTVKPTPVDDADKVGQGQRYYQQFGPQVGRLLSAVDDAGKPTHSLDELGAALFREDQARAAAGQKGYVNSNRDDLMKWLTSHYSESELRDNLFPSRVNGSIGGWLNPLNRLAGNEEQLRSFFGVEPTEEDKGRAALRKFLGYDPNEVHYPEPPMRLGR